MFFHLLSQSKELLRKFLIPIPKLSFGLAPFGWVPSFAFRNRRPAAAVARPPRLSEQARDGGQARPSSWPRDPDS